MSACSNAAVGRRYEDRGGRNHPRRGSARVSSTAWRRSSALRQTPERNSGTRSPAGGSQLPKPMGSKRMRLQIAMHAACVRACEACSVRAIPCKDGMAIRFAPLVSCLRRGSHAGLLALLTFAPLVSRLRREGRRREAKSARTVFWRLARRAEAWRPRGGYAEARRRCHPAALAGFRLRPQPPPHHFRSATGCVWMECDCVRACACARPARCERSPRRVGRSRGRVQRDARRSRPEESASGDPQPPQ